VAVGVVDPNGTKKIPHQLIRVSQDKAPGGELLQCGSATRKATKEKPASVDAGFSG
jgi:hypothetical protein